LRKITNSIKDFALGGGAENPKLAAFANFVLERTPDPNFLVGTPKKKITF
jgi:hypothetical protein